MSKILDELRCCELFDRLAGFFAERFKLIVSEGYVKIFRLISLFEYVRDCGGYGIVVVGAFRPYDRELGCYGVLPYIRVVDSLVVSSPIGILFEIWQFMVLGGVVGVRVCL